MTIAIIPNPHATTLDLRAGPSVDANDFAAIRRRMMLDFCKWDAQVEDVSTLADFPLILSGAAWNELKSTAESLARETLALESHLLARPDLHYKLGLPSRLRRLFRSISEDNLLTPSAARVMRFDFHPTPDGWRVSEVNSDVPGGFTESSAFTEMIAAHSRDVEIIGNPQSEYIAALAQAASSQPGRITLLAAPGFMEDQQVVSGLANRLRHLGLETILAEPRQLEWKNNRAFLSTSAYTGPVSAIVRFYQGEWLSSLPRYTNWQYLFTGGKTPVANPGVAILSESKRLPLIWDELGIACPTWRRVLPETRDPRTASWRNDDTWLLKTAFCNTGDSVTIRQFLSKRAWLVRSLDVMLHPNQWLAQKRFETHAIDTPIGPMFPCLGVYTVNGHACGIYGRLSPHPVIAYSAIDVAVLVEQNSVEGSK